jgi:hypothetical protein
MIPLHDLKIPYHHTEIYNKVNCSVYQVVGQIKLTHYRLLQN